MSKKQKHEFGEERSPVRVIIYILTVVILVAGLGYLVYYSRQRREEHQAKVAEIAAKETEFVIKQRVEEPETETEGETQPAASRVTEKKPEGVTEEESETESDAIEKDTSVVVLNGTGRPGVAGYWEAQLEEQGYINVNSASYSLPAEARTVLYAAEEEMAQPFLEYFPSAVINEGAVETGIEWDAGVEPPENIEVYIVVGTEDVRSQ